MTAVHEEFAKTFAFVFTVLLASVLTLACGGNSSTSPTTPTPDTLTETFSGTLPVGGSAFYSFSTATTGTVTATLTGIGGAGVPPSVVVNLGIGTLSAFTCTASAVSVQVTGTAAVPTLVTTSEQPGVYCVIISDIGNLFAPATFTVTIDHPVKAAS